MATLMNLKLYLVEKELVDGTWRNWKGAYSTLEEAELALNNLKGDGAKYRIKVI